MLVDFRDTSFGGCHRYQGIRFESIPHFMPKERVLPKLCGDDHPSSGKELLGRLRAGFIGVHVLLRERQRIQLLLLHEVGVVIRDEVKDDFVGLDAETLP